MTHMVTEAEITAILGKRATQIANGSRPKVDYGAEVEAWKIAMQELREGVIPIIIVRKLPSGEIREKHAQEIAYEAVLKKLI